MASFASALDMISRYDSRTLGDLCSDDGNRVTEQGLTSNLKMTTALSSATGQVKAAVLRGERYTTDELAALTGDGLDYLKDITCSVAFWSLWRRKPYSDDQNRLDSKQKSDEALEMLRKGDHVFDIARQQEAGRANVDTVTRVEIENDWSLVNDQMRGRFFPRRRTYKNR